MFHERPRFEGGAAARCAGPAAQAGGQEAPCRRRPAKLAQVRGGPVAASGAGGAQADGAGARRR